MQTFRKNSILQIISPHVKHPKIKIQPENVSFPPSVAGASCAASASAGPGAVGAPGGAALGWGAASGGVGCAGSKATLCGLGFLGYGVKPQMDSNGIQPKGQIHLAIEPEMWSISRKDPKGKKVFRNPNQIVAGRPQRRQPQKFSTAL